MTAPSPLILVETITTTRTDDSDRPAAAVPLVVAAEELDEVRTEEAADTEAEEDAELVVIMA